jgi:hypothetical protein
MTVGPQPRRRLRDAQVRTRHGGPRPGQTVCLDALEQRREALATTDAHCFEAEATATAL